ncbi:HNH endonuclease signature motif containing protein [Pedobacter sp.]|jgi:putative restriction endonuclease|uniref:HNH endonuclease n=1 Tax=Pedobacter sp. TaxID=1411316 RepID=UPI002CC46A2F|nr:HNH endonuclease signature motif containing protein [Pedobacter sp.]HWW37835.1 HNH endonuclease signature motif containing protein [Pedobacter sp.]
MSKNKIKEEKPNLWVLKSVTDSEKSYQTIESYKDEIEKRYNYDNKVANSKQIKANDYAILTDKHQILGFARIEIVSSQESKKKITKCKICGSTTIDTRKTLKPTFRCNRGHEFEKPLEITIPVIKYSALYSNTFIESKAKTNVLSLRPYYINGYNQNMSMQLLDIDAFRLFPSIYKQLQGKSTTIVLLPSDADDESKDSHESPFIPGSKDERESIKRQIKARRGQQKFRNNLRKRYGDICMITGCEILDILEAAHIKPYRGVNDNHSSNGLLLRADIHTLFDLNLIGIEPKSLIIHISTRLENTEYKSYDNKVLLTSSKKPEISCLENRWREFCSFNRISKE